jgi:hypothetical protein
MERAPPKPRTSRMVGTAIREKMRERFRVGFMDIGGIFPRPSQLAASIPVNGLRNAGVGRGEASP